MMATLSPLTDYCLLRAAKATPAQAAMWRRLREMVRTEAFFGGLLDGMFTQQETRYLEYFQWRWQFINRRER